ncbi:acyl-CoA thioesterase [Evansella halocellulosilytica]|uniref:acyl-CoA thioesterase n=1 Tax=Evansella halocellulosilytica TaxID=2011013 RepID=UPI000BB938F7|nr:thioesterase family protein [Evansella halocellulosilytica]
MFRKRIEPRVSETDGAGHINNTTLPIWFEAGRDEIFKLFTPDLSFSNWKCVIIKMNVEYLHQIYYGKEVLIKTFISKVKNSSFEVYEEVHQDGILCAKGQAVYVNFNFEKQKAEPIPDGIKEKLNEHLIRQDT